MDQELERARRLLEQSEDSRESLVQQVGLRLFVLYPSADADLQQTSNWSLLPQKPLSDRQLPFSVSADAQVEDLRGELLRTRKEKTELQRVRLEAFQPAAQAHGNHIDREEGRSAPRGPGTGFRSGSAGGGKDTQVTG